MNEATLSKVYQVLEPGPVVLVTTARPTSCRHRAKEGQGSALDPLRAEPLEPIRLK